MSKQNELAQLADAVTVDGSNVGIGTTPSTDWRTAFNTTATQVGLTGSLFNLDVSTSDRRCMVSSNAILNASGDFQHILEGHATVYSQQSGTHRWYTAPSASAGSTAAASERMLIGSGSDGAVMFGTTITNPVSNNVVGISARGAYGELQVSTEGSTGAPLYLNRKTSDGDIATFRKDGSTVGSLGTGYGGSTHFGIKSHSADLRFSASNGVVTWDGTQFYPALSGSRKLGHPNHRWEDAWVVNGVTTGSDANDKQDIATLTATEMLVAARLSQTFRTYRWKDKVVEKGDNARTHTGTIAQEVQAAFTAEGLDAGDYAMFMSDTWWEHDVDVPAVEAVAEVTDEDGNVTTESVEAVDAYTHTDTYDTEAEAPEGATERTRLGIRYPELLSFVAAYNEQRFASIEARLTALEA